MALHEGTADGDRVRGRQAISEGRRFVAALDRHVGALDNPLDTLTVEVRVALVEGVDVGIAPDLARAWRSRRQAPARARWLVCVGTAPLLLGRRPCLPGIAIVLRRRRRRRRRRATLASLAAAIALLGEGPHLRIVVSQTIE